MDSADSAVARWTSTEKHLQSTSFLLSAKVEGAVLQSALPEYKAHLNRLHRKVIGAKSSALTIINEHNPC
jgi:hypothetical protein